MDADVLIVGGGVIGTAIAWRTAREGRTVTLIDPDTDDKASLVAAGMLGPVSESVFGEQHLLNLNLHAVDRFPAFNAELEQATGMETGLRTEGTLAVAYDSDDLAALDRLTAFRHSIGLKAERLDAKQCRRLEPFLAPGTKGGVLASGDLSVDSRRYLAALRLAARQAGVRIVTGQVTEVSPGPDGPLVRLVTRGERDGIAHHEIPEMSGLMPAALDAATLTARQVVISAGHAAGRIAGLPDQLRKAIRPVKGQILRLRHPRNLPPVLTHTVRAIVGGHDVYLVPRADGELVVGATQEERDDRDVTAGAVHDLLRDAMTAVPAISELIFAEASAGLRPGTVDNGPILGPAALFGPVSSTASAGPGGVIIAAGHFRNGILLSAATADAVAAILSGADTDLAWAPFTPDRFR
jgi:glycine oxidase